MKQHVKRPGVYFATYSAPGKEAVPVVVQVSGKSPLLNIDHAIHIGARTPITYLPNRLDLDFGKRLKLRTPAASPFPTELNVTEPGLYLATYHRKRKRSRICVVQVSGALPMLSADFCVFPGVRKQTALVNPRIEKLTFHKRLKVQFPKT